MISVEILFRVFSVRFSVRRCLNFSRLLQLIFRRPLIIKTKLIEDFFMMLIIKNYTTILLLSFSVLSCSNYNKTIYGHWKLVPEQSTDLVTWRYRLLELEIKNNQGEITILQKWIYRKKIAFVDSITFIPGNEPSYILQKSSTWSENWYMGVLTQKGSKKKVYGFWKEEHRILQVETQQEVQTSQGEALSKTDLEFRLQNNGENLIIIKKRSTRPTPILLVFKRVT